MSAGIEKCGRCGAWGTRPIRIIMRNQLLATGHLCEPCMDQVLLGFEEVKQRYAELIEAGVSKRDANRIMCERIDGGATS